MLALFVIAALTLLSIARSQNLLMAEHSKVEVARGLQANVHALATVIRDYSFWDEAYEHAGKEKVDVEWAYDKNNVGPSLYKLYSLEGVFIVGADQNTRYSLVKGQLGNTSAAQFLGADIVALTELARKRAADDETLYGYYLVSGQPAIVYAAAVKPTGMVDPTALAQMSVMIFVDILDVTALNKEFGTHLLHVDHDVEHAGHEPFLDLQSPMGIRLRLHWTPDRPGDAFLQTLLPLLFVIATLFGLAMWFLERRMMRAAVEFDVGRNALERSELRFRSVTEASSDWVWETDGEYRISYLSDRFEAMTGFSISAWIGTSFCEFVNISGPALERLSIEGKNGSGTSARRQTECSYLDINGLPRHCRLSVRKVMEKGVTVGYRGTVSDVTEEVEIKRRIKHMSQHDALTGLANRSYLYSHLQTRLAQLDNPLYILSLDLDRFKPINDTLGHAMGDQVLCEVAARLRQCVREDDFVARLGGDEFVLIIEHLPPGHSIENVCARVCASIAKTIRRGEHDLNVGVSIGVVCAPIHGQEPSDLLRYADIALYATKAAGRNTWRLYTTEMNELLLERRQVEIDLKRAIAGHELFLEFQPRFAVDGKILVGAEALVRWSHPVRGRVMPDQFIAIAEETGLIVGLSDWVLRSACIAALTWGNGLSVSVNLSPVEFQRSNLVTRIDRVLKATGLDPARLELEITETVLLEDSASALLTMNELKALGVRLSMDDFGTGYSSLSYLRTYPFDGIKIDRSFIADLQGDTRATGIAIMESIISLGKALTMTVTAEGVETHSQLTDLVTINCDEAQGYLLGRPLAADAFRNLAYASLATP